MHLTRSAVIAVLVLSCCAGIAGSQIGSAHAATTNSGLPIKNEYQVVADTAHGHLFISQGTFAANGQGAYSDDSIIVTNLSGGVVATIPGQDGVEGMVLSPGGSTLYAALSTGGAVTAISTETLKETASYPLASGDQAYSVAVQSGALWVSYRDALGQGAIGSFNPSVTASFTPNAVQASWVSSAPQIAADPTGIPGILAASSVGVSPSIVATFDVSTPAAVTELASSTTIGPCAPWHGLSVLPGGNTLLCDGAAYSTASLSPLGATLENAGIIAVSPDGAVAMGSAAEGTNLGGPLEDLWVHSSDSATEPAAVDSLGGQNAFLTDLAWSASSQQLFAIVVTTDSSEVPTSYRVVSLSPFTDPFQFLASGFKLTGNATRIGYDGEVTVTARLGLTDTTSASISLYKQPAGGAKTLIASGGNSTAITFAAKLTRTTTFTAVFTGTVWWSTKTDTQTLRVTVGVGVKLIATLSGYYKRATISGTSYHVYHQGAVLKDAVAVTPNKRGECVQLLVQHFARGAWHPYAKTGCTALSSSSKATLALRLAALGQFRVSPVFVHAAKDTANVSTDGPWQYYDVTK